MKISIKITDTIPIADIIACLSKSFIIEEYNVYNELLIVIVKKRYA